ncbi:uncharacterized protein LOC62_06G008198 [Vanrija pseudolonga]|uniref:Uncharacterized protein n=1 Tax=Vanrija pseudolonga TaxID=143232 RepID=A0AAF0YH87_9TREE|nr:hypothetical protein LOC62_06G008198 [Vanrija pseudolonga]
MASTSPRPHHPAPAYVAASSRAHPYAGHQQQHHRRRPSPSGQQDDRERRLPPSPPRSRRDASYSPPMSAKQAPSPPAADPTDNFWDDVPAPPSSLKSILDSFRRSGEGDRDLLMAILGAKKSEEERLTSVIQTRLTILQARLNLAAIQAQMQAMPPMPDPSQFQGYPPERTPSLSRGSVSSDNSSPRPSVSLPSHGYAGYPAGYASERIHLPPPAAMYERDHPRERGDRLPPLREDDRRSAPSPRDRRPPSPGDDRRPPGGLEMLLEGVREAERKELA